MKENGTWEQHERGLRHQYQLLRQALCQSAGQDIAHTAQPAAGELTLQTSASAIESSLRVELLQLTGVMQFQAAAVGLSKENVCRSRVRLPRPSAPPSVPNCSLRYSPCVAYSQLSPLAVLQLASIIRDQPSAKLHCVAFAVRCVSDNLKDQARACAPLCTLLRAAVAAGTTIGRLELDVHLSDQSGAALRGQAGSQPLLWNRLLKALQHAIESIALVECKLRLMSAHHVQAYDELHMQQLTQASREQARQRRLTLACCLHRAGARKRNRALAHLPPEIIQDLLQRCIPLESHVEVLNHENQ